MVTVYILNYFLLLFIFTIYFHDLSPGQTSSRGFSKIPFLFSHQRAPSSFLLINDLSYKRLVNLIKQIARFTRLL